MAATKAMANRAFHHSMAVHHKCGHHNMAFHHTCGHHNISGHHNMALHNKGGHHNISGHHNNSGSHSRRHHHRNRHILDGQENSSTLGHLVMAVGKVMGHLHIGKAKAENGRGKLLLGQSKADVHLMAGKVGGLTMQLVSKVRNLGPTTLVQVHRGYEKRQG